MQQLSNKHPPCWLVPLPLHLHCGGQLNGFLPSLGGIAPWLPGGLHQQKHVVMIVRGG